LKCGSEEFVLVDILVGDGNIFYNVGQRKQLDLCGGADGASVDRRLEDAGGFVGRCFSAATIAVIVPIFVTRCLSSLKEVMHLVGRRVEQEE
jgi:hypothetical protein